MILGDLLVVELASVLAGPSVGMWLAELGARVIKVEYHLRGGDVTRAWKLPGEDGEDDRSAYFSSVNWGKESIGVDLRSEKGKQIIYELAGKADVVIASYKPGDAVKLGMDAGTLMALNPSLIYVDLTAYGPDDPRVGFDAIIQAEAGFTYMNGDPASGPTKMPVALMDLLAAHQLKEGVLLALLSRMTTGQGKHVSTSLIKAGISSLANQATNWLVAGHLPQPIGSDHPNIVPYGTIFYCQGQQGIVLAIGNDRQFSGLAEVLGCPEWKDDERLRSNGARVANRAYCKGLIQGKVNGWEREELLQALHRAKVPVGSVRNMEEVFEQGPAREMTFQGETMAGLRSVALTGVGNPLALSEPPHMGQDGEKVLNELLGYSEERIGSLRSDGILA